MSIMCAISGTAPEEPVFAAKTGYVYEKRLIVKHIESAGKCPVTQDELSRDDLAEVKCNKAVRPRPATATSIPGMLSLLQSEWDSLMTETYELKGHLDTTRKQLAHALYQHDAACRVIARLLRERDASRAQVAGLQEQLANSRPAEAGDMADEGETGLTPEIVQRMSDMAKSLSRTRKQRNFPSLAPLADVKQMKCAGSHPVHQSTAPGILCLDVHRSDDRRIVTGGVDSQVIIFDAEKEKTAQKLIGHSKKVTSVLFHANKEVVLSGSADTTVRVWACSDESDFKAPYKCTNVVQRHSGQVTDLSIHPLGEYFVSSSLDKSWALHDLSSGRCVRHLQDLTSSYNCLKFHPDGLILAGGGDERTVAVWDIKEQVVVASLTGHEGEIESISFSENGYYLATGARDGVLKLWDLRKPINLQTFQVSDSPVTSVRFDLTGQYLTVCSEDVQVYNWETKSKLDKAVTLSDHTAAVTDVCWGLNARSLFSVSMDRTLRLWRPPTP